MERIKAIIGHLRQFVTFICFGRERIKVTNMPALSDADMRLLAASYKHMKTKPEIDWEGLLKDTDYKNLSTLRTRYGQILKKIKDADGPGSANTSKPVSPSKRAKPGAGRDKVTVKKDPEDGDDEAEEGEEEEEGDSEQVPAPPSPKRFRHGRPATAANQAVNDWDDRVAAGDTAIHEPEGFIHNRLDKYDTSPEDEWTYRNGHRSDEDLIFPMDL